MNTTRSSRRLGITPSFINRLSRSLVAATLAALGIGSTQAVNVLWDNNPLDDLTTLGTSDWASGGNWLGGLAPAITADAIFGAPAVGAPGNITLTSAQTINSLTFNVTGYTISDVVAQVLTITSGNVTTTAAVTATIADTVDGLNGLTLAGGGTLVLAGVNTFTGAVSINAGTLSVGLDENLGALANGVTIDGGALRATGIFTSARAVTIGALGGAVDVTTGNALTLSTALVANGNALTKTSVGTLILGAASARTGATNVNGGVLQLTDLAALGTGGVAVASGGALEGNAALAGTYGQLVTLNGGTFSQAANNVMTLATAGQLNLAANSTINVTQVGPGGKLLLVTPDVVAGSGNINKTGAGTLQFSVANTGYTGALTVSGGQAEIQNAQALGAAPSVVTIAGGEMVVSNSTWAGPILATGGGAISGNSGNSTYAGPITANGQFAARARDFQNLAQGRALTISGQISGAGGLVAQGPTAGAGRVLITANNSAWTGAIQVDPLAQAVVTVGFGAGAVTSLPTGDITLNGGRLSIGPSIGTGLASTAGIVGRWINYGAVAINDTFLTPWFTPTAATRTDAVIDSPLLSNVSTVSGLPTGGGLPTGIGVLNGLFFDRYAVAFNGLFNITAGGDYTFYMPSDDGASLFIDGQQVSANEGGHGIATVGQGIATLGAGLHQITLKNTNGTTGGGIQLAYSGVDQPVLPVGLGGVAGITNMAEVALKPLTNVTGGLTTTLANTITVPDQVAPTSTTLDTSGFDTISNGAMTVGANGTLIFASGTSHSFTQAGPVTLAAGAGLSSSAQAVTVPVATTLTPANVFITGNVTLNGTANLISDAVGALSITSVIDDGAGSFGLTKSGNGAITLGGTAANTFEGALLVNQGLVLLNKTAGVNAVGAGGININTTIGAVATFDAGVVRLLASNQIPDAAPVTITTTGSLGARFDLNNFSETVGAVSLASTTGNLAGISTGPAGVLTLTGDITMLHQRDAVGNTGRELLITGNSATYTTLTASNTQLPGVGMLDLGGARNITVETTNDILNLPGSDGTIETAIVNGSITKLGSRTLTLNGSNPNLGLNSTFAGGVTVAAGVIRGAGAGAVTSSAFGTGTITLNTGSALAATVELRNNGAIINTLQGGTASAVLIGQSANNPVLYGNPVNISASVPEVGFDVNANNIAVNGNTPVGSGGTHVLGILKTNALAQIDVTGGNNFSLRFNGLDLAGPLTVKPTTGNLQLWNLGTALANNINSAIGTTGSLFIGGTGTGFSGNIDLTNGGTLRLVPRVGAVNDLLGTGTLTLLSSPTIGISPTLEGGVIAAGISGSLSARYYQTNVAGGINTTNYSVIPSGLTSVTLLSDGALTNRPPGVTGTSFTNDTAVYSGLLNITTAGLYTFQTYVDDQSQLVIDGIPLISVNAGAGGTGLIHSPVSVPVQLSAGAHTIAVKVYNNGSGGGFGVLYKGADSGGLMRPIPSTALAKAVPFVNVANTGLNQNIPAGGAITLDGGGTDLDGGINNLSFDGATGTVNATNLGGIGTTTVSGATNIGANIGTFNTTTGGLALLGDVLGTGFITKTGAGSLYLVGPKTFDGVINITTGGVQVNDPNSLGTTTGATNVASGGVLDLNGVALGAEPLSLAGAGIANVAPAALWNSASSPASVSGNITVNAVAAVVGGLGDITLSGIISSGVPAVAWSKIGPNTLTLTSPDNTFTTPFTVSAGVLKLGAGANGATSPLGTIAGNTTVAVGAVLDLAGFSIAEPLVINGAGLTNFGLMNTLGALINTSTTASVLSGNLAMASASNIGSSSLAPGGDISINGIISGGFALTKVGGNTLTITTNSSYTGGTVINLGGIILTGGGIIDDGNTTVNPTATLTLDNTITTANQRLGARSVTLFGGNLNILGNNTPTPVTEALAGGVITTSSVNSVITLTPNSPTNGGVTLSSTAVLARASNGTILFRGDGLGNTPGLGVSTILVSTTIPSIGQVGAANFNNRAIMPWALADQSSTGVGTSFAGHLAVSGIQVLGPNDYSANAVVANANILLNDGLPALAPAGVTMVNSLTMDAASTLNIPAGNSINLDSGGILGRTATISTITGPGNLSALNTLLPVTSAPTVYNNLYTPREFIVQTPGIAELFINAPIGNSTTLVAINPLNTSGFTKAGSGTLTLGAQNFFLATTRLNGGTTVLAGGPNTIYFPVMTPAVTGALTSGMVAGNLVIDPGATLDLNGLDQRFGGYGSNLTAGTTALPGTGGVITNNSTTADANLTFSQGATFVVSSSINASTVPGAMKTNLQRDGGFIITMTAPNTYTGTTTLNGGVLLLQDGGTLSGTSAITINRSVLKLDESQLQTIPDRISATTPITLNGGAITFTGRGGGTQNEWNLGQVTVGLGLSLLQQTMVGSTNANSSGSARLNVANLIRGGVGSQVAFNFIQSGNQSIGDNPRVYLSQLNGGALPAPGVMLPAWATVIAYNPASAAGGTSGTINNVGALSLDFAQYDPVTGLRPVLYTSTFAPGNNVNIGNNTTLPAGGVVINALRLGNIANTVVSFANGGFDTLNVQSGGIIGSIDANNRFIGSYVNGGNITAGGVNPGGPRELFIYNAANTLTLNARITNNPTDGSVVSPVFSAASQISTIQLNGSNTYTGTTYVNGVILNLNAQAGAVAIPGDLVLSGNTSNAVDSQAPGNQITRFLAANQIAPTSNITLNGGTLLDLNGFANTVNNLTFAADGGSNSNQGPSVQTGSAGLLTLNGGITATNLLQATTIPTIQGNLALPAGVHPIVIGTHTAAPGQVNFQMNSVLTGAGNITKTGSGVLGLGNSSPAFAGSLTVDAGSIQATANNIVVNAPVNLGAGGTLNAGGGFNSTFGTLTGTGTVTSSQGGLTVISQFIGNLFVVPQVNVGVDNGTGNFDGLVTSNVAIGKVGTGTFKLTNTSNSYTGGTFVNGGTFVLGGLGNNTTGTGVVTVSNGAKLTGEGLVNGGLQFNAGSTANFTLGTPADFASIYTNTASVAVTGATTFNIAGTTGTGVYPLIVYGGAPLTVQQLAGLKLGTTPGGGLLYGLVNNGVGLSIDLSVEAVGTGNTWTGATDGVWDTATANWMVGSYADGQQITFDNAGAKKAVTGTAVNPQAITVNNTGANNYTIANPIGGALAGGLTKTGTASLQLTGANTFTGGIAVNGGTLRANVSTAANSLGSGSVTLASGATLSFDAASTLTAGLTGRTIVGGLGVGGNTVNNDFSQPAVDARTYFAAGASNLGGAVPTPFYPGGPGTTFGVQFIGKLKVDVAGPYSLFASSDDGTRIFIDGALVVNNDAGKGQFEAGNSLMLTTGLHDIRVDYGQGTGGGILNVSWQGPGIAKANIPGSNLFTAETSSNAGSSSLVNAGTSLTANGNSTLNLNGANFTGVQLGTLTSPTGTTLNVTGSANKLARATSTILSGGTVTYNTVADLALGQVVDGGVATTILKTGNGRLFLDNTAALASGQSTSLVAGTILEIQAGKLVATGNPSATNPLGAAQVRLNGGGLLLDSKHRGLTFDNAVTVAQNALIEVLPAGVTTTLGSAANGITLQSASRLTLDLYGGARTNGANFNQAIGVQGAALTVPGSITGTGDLAFRSTMFDLGMYPVYGSAIFTANNTFAGTTTLTGGFGAQGIVTTMFLTLNGTGRLSGSTGITLNAAQLNVDDSGTVNTGRLNAAAPVPVTMNTATVFLSASTTANSGETIGALTLGNGLNRIAITNTPGAAVTGLLTAASLTRNNRSVVQFQGVTLGGAALAADLVKFITVPTLVGAGGANATPLLSVLPYAFGTANPGTNPPTYMPVTYDATNGIRPINTTTEITTVDTAAANGNARNVITAAAAPIPTLNAINSLVFDNSTAAALTVTLTNNPVLFSGTGAGLLLLTTTNGTQSALTITGNAINFQGAEGNIVVTSSAGATISSAILGSNGLTVTGNNNTTSNALQTTSLLGGTLTLTADNSVGLTGLITINGRITLNNGTTDTPLGNPANPIQFGGGMLAFTTTGTTIAATRAITIPASSFGAIETNGGNQTIAGPISGAGALIKMGTGNLTLNNLASNYTGTTSILQGNLVTNTGPQGNILLSGSGSNVNFTQSIGGTYTGNISGIGSVTINVTNFGNTLTLGDPNDATKGVNTYGGGTTVASAGTTLRGTTSSLVGGIVANAGSGIIAYEQNFNGTINAVISGSTGFSKAGASTLEIINNMPYTGVTEVNAGTLRVLGALTGTSTALVNAADATLDLLGSISGSVVVNDGIFQGTGTIGSGLILLGGVTHPGTTTAPGIVNMTGASSLLFFRGGALNVNLAGSTTAGTDYDQIRLTGPTAVIAATTNTPLILSLGAGYTPLGDGTEHYTLIALDNVSPAAANYSGFTFTASGVPILDDEEFNYGGYAWNLDYNGGTDGNDLILTSVPEPSSALLLLGGLAATIAPRRRKKQPSAE